MSFFPLRYSATLKRAVVAADRSGQKNISSYTEIPVAKCLFLETSGNKSVVAKEQFQAIFAFYVEPTVDINVGDLVVNIKDRKGTIVEAGPLEVLSAKKVPDLSGTIHHISCKLKGAA